MARRLMRLRIFLSEVADVFDRDNILEIIADHQRDIDKINAEMERADSEVVKRALQKELNFLVDNQYRYKLQARAWGLQV